jgi:glycosyltransferase involved in cell wall biosynthesis
MLTLCSDNEGFPNVLLEAMAARLPVITTPAGDCGRVIEDSVTGYVVPFGDVKALSDRMVILGKDLEIRKQFGEAGRKRVEQEYSFDQLAAKLIHTYRDVARQQEKRRVLNSLPAISHAS